MEQAIQALLPIGYNINIAGSIQLQKHIDVQNFRQV